MAKPIDTAWACGGIQATLMPTTSPLPFTSAPPELPGDMAARSG